MNTDLILDFFDVTYNNEPTNPKIKLKLKEQFKENKSHPIRPNGIPYSGVQQEYYIHYLGDVLGNEVFHERKKLCAKTNLIQWYVDTFKPDDSKMLLQEKNMIGRRVSASLQKHYESPAGDITRNKLQLKQKKWATIIGKKNSERWKTDPAWRDKQIQTRKDSGHYERISEKNRERMLDPEYKKRFVAACNAPDRIQKISRAAKNMWHDARKNDPDKFYRMLLSHKQKNFKINGYDMNSIEYQIALILNDLSLEWQYETTIHLNDKSYVPDFLVQGNIIVECFGDFWHANPKYFKPTDTTHKSRIAADIWKYDEEKIVSLKENSYTVIVLWENDILTDVEKCKQIIKEHI